MSNYFSENNSLCHHGIKGQKWGVRRFQNKDGSLTVKGRLRARQMDKYRTESGELSSAGKMRFRNDGTRKTMKNMSDEEIEQAMHQMAREKAFKEMKNGSDGVQTSKSALKTALGKVAVGATATAATMALTNKLGDEEQHVDDIKKKIILAASTTAITSLASAYGAQNINAGKSYTQGKDYSKYDRNLESKLGKPAGSINGRQLTPDENKRYQGLLKDNDRDVVKSLKRKGYSVDQIEQYFKHSEGQMYDDYLQHHGVKGQKWGVRRYQNKDGSLIKSAASKAGGTAKYAALSTRANARRAVAQALYERDWNSTSKNMAKKADALQARANATNHLKRSDFGKAGELAGKASSKLADRKEERLNAEAYKAVKMNKEHPFTGAARVGLSAFAANTTSKQATKLGEKLVESAEWRAYNDRPLDMKQVATVKAVTRGMKVASIALTAYAYKQSSLQYNIRKQRYRNYQSMQYQRADAYAKKHNKEKVTPTRYKKVDMKR